MSNYRNIINPEVVEYITSLYRPVNEDFGRFRAEAEADRVPIILPDTESLILNLLRIMKPQRILEIGTAVGYSASCFASVCDADITTVEVNEETARIARANIDRLGLSDRIDVLCGDGEEIVNNLDVQYDFVFIDAAKSHYKRFWEAAVRHCASGAVIVSDNVLFKARVVSDKYDETGKYKTNIRRMREFVEYITNVDYADTALLPVGDGVAISILK